MDASEADEAKFDAGEAIETDFVAGDAVESMRDAVGAVPDPSCRCDVRDAEAPEVCVLTRSQARRIIHGRGPPKLWFLDALLLASASFCEVSVFVWSIAFSHTQYANESRAWKVLCQRVFQWEVVTALFPRGRGTSAARDLWKETHPVIVCVVGGVERMCSSP